MGTANTGEKLRRTLSRLHTPHLRNRRTNERNRALRGVVCKSARYARSVYKKTGSRSGFLKELTTQKAFVENLIANNSFIKKLTTQDAFLDNLVAKKLKIDNDGQNPNDFEVAINNDIGILAKNNGQEIFRIKKSGEAFLNDAELKNVTVTGKITPNRGLLNTWYWGKMANTNQYEWFNVFKDRIETGTTKYIWREWFV